MTELSDDIIRAKRKQNIRRAAGIFAGCLLLLTFFSNTYQQLTLPKVSVEHPQTGQLAFDIEGEGAIQPKRTVSLYDQTGWLVKEVLVEDGDAVTRGQPLIVFDPSPAEQSLADEQDRYAKQQLELAKLQDRLKEAGRGGVTSQIEDLTRQVHALKLDMAIQARKIEDIQRDIAEKTTLAAPFDGKITGVEADEGLAASPGRAVVEIADLSRGWVLEARMDADSASRLMTGEQVDVRIKETVPRFVKGHVAEIEHVDSGGGPSNADEDDSGMKRVTLDISDDKLAGGEQAEFRLTKRSGTPKPLVPLSAIRTDSQGEYIFVIEETKKPLGNEFRVVKKYVHTEDSDETNAMLSGPVPPEEKIVTESSEPLSDGDLVSLN